MQTYVPAICITSRRKIRYRFTCEQCGKDSGWLEKNFSKDFTYDSGNATKAALDVNGKITDEGLAKAQREARETGDFLLACDIRPYYHNAQNGVFGSSVFRGTCPHCSKSQSWTAAMSFSSLFKTSLIISIVLSLMIICFMYVFLTYNKYAHWSLYCGLPIFLILFIPSALWLAIRKLRARNVANPQKPVIDWNGYIPPTI